MGVVIYWYYSFYYLFYNVLQFTFLKCSKLNTTKNLNFKLKNQIDTRTLKKLRVQNYELINKKYYNGAKSNIYSVVNYHSRNRKTHQQIFEKNREEKCFC